jgi:tetratricopeptide (TPR) repeat protein
MKRSSRNRHLFAVAVVLSTVLLAGAWAFAFRDDIRFSRVVSSFSGAPSVLIAENLSGITIASKTGTASNQRLVSFVNSLVQEPHRTRICDRATCPDSSIALAISGEVTDTKFGLDICVPQSDRRSQPPHPTKLADLLAEIDSPSFAIATAFDTDPILIHVDAPPQAMSEVLKAAYHLSAAVRFGRVAGTESAGRHLERFLDLVRVLPVSDVSRDWILEGILFGMAYYGRSRDWNAALEVARTGARAFPADPRLQVAQTYVVLLSNEGADVNARLSGIRADLSMVEIVQAVLEARNGNFWKASTLLEDAIRLLEPSAALHRQLGLHIAVSALLAATSTGEIAERGSRIIEHAKRTLDIDPNLTLLRLLQAYGYALKGNGPQSDELFEAIRLKTAPTGPTSVDIDYWRARAYAETGRADEARRLAEAGAATAPTHPELLGLLAELIIEKGTAESREESVKLAARALEADPREVKSNRILGLYKAQRAGRLLRSLREPLEQQALAHLKAAERGGGANSQIYDRMSDIYRDLAKTTEARALNRKSLELACSDGKDVLSCRVRDVRDFLDRHDVSGAKKVTNEMIAWVNEHARNGEDTGHRVEVMVQLAIIWYQNGSLKIAEQLYSDIVDDLRWTSFQAHDPAVATVECNLAFIYIDEGMNDQAIRLFNSSLQLQNVPDCQAGLAVALLRSNQPNTALVAYRKARAHDESYSPRRLDILRTFHAWSQTACNALVQLDRLDKQASPAGK